MRLKFVEQQSWTAARNQKNTFIKVIILWSAVVYHHVHHFTTAHIHQRLISILPALFHKQSMIKISIWKSERKKIFNFFKYWKCCNIFDGLFLVHRSVVWLCHLKVKCLYKWIALRVTVGPIFCRMLADFVVSLSAPLFWASLNCCIILHFEPILHIATVATLMIRIAMHLFFHIYRKMASIQSINSQN